MKYSLVSDIESISDKLKLNSPETLFISMKVSETLVELPY